MEPVLSAVFEDVSCRERECNQGPIGSSLRGNLSSSYRGLLDDVSVRCTAVPEEELVARFVSTLPPPAEPSLAEVWASPNTGGSRPVPITDGGKPVAVLFS